MGSEVSVTGDRVPRGLTRPLRTLIRTTLAQESARPGEIGIVLTDDAALRELNRRWRGIDRATDVLSFPYDSGDPGGSALLPAGGDWRVVSGDLVISLDRMADQARRYRVSRGRELARLVVHGTLHLAGHDHHRPGERKRMRAREAKTLRAAGATIRALDARLDGSR
jgi:probable rRNA maturation factor